MTEKDLARTWSQYVKELAVLLVAVEGRDPPPEVLERIQALVQRELLFLYIRCAAPCPAPACTGVCCCEGEAFFLLTILAEFLQVASFGQADFVTATLQPAHQC